MKGRAEQRPTWREDRAKAMEKTALVSQRESSPPTCNLVLNFCFQSREEMGPHCLNREVWDIL